MKDKWVKLRKQTRNDMLVAYVKSHPEAGLSDVGKVFNISKQRVFQIVKRAERG